MCAAESWNLTDGVDYFLGTNEVAYHIGLTGLSTVINQMDSGVQWLYENGTNAEGWLGRYAGGYTGGSVYVYTQDE